MKKILFIIFLLISIGISVMSCSSVQDCPAYGQLKYTDEKENIV